MKIKLIFVLCFYSMILFCQESSIPKITNDDFKNIEITREDYFNDGSLWGYMNGGADLYLEYGFDKLLVEEVVIDGEEIKIEVFKMNNHNAAFGIYSLKHYKCNDTRADQILSCITNYQYQIVLSNFYISIINNTSSEKAKNISRQIADKFVKIIHQKDYPFPGFLQNELILKNINNSQFMYSRLGISNGHEEWEEIFEDLDDYLILKIPVVFEGEKFTVIQIEMNDADVSKIITEYNFGTEENLTIGCKSIEKDYTYWMKKIEKGKYIFIEGSFNNLNFENMLTKGLNIK